MNIPLRKNLPETGILRTLTVAVAMLLATFSTAGGQGSATGSGDPMPKAESHPLTLIEGGEGRAVIYLAPDHTEVAALAASELQEHLRLATGVTLRIVGQVPEDPGLNVVYVGPSKAAAALGVDAEGLPSEGYRIRTAGKNLFLLGDDSDGSPFPSLIWSQKHPLRYGSLKAVYRLLEAVCGIRWYMPGELGRVVPPSDEVVVPEVNLEGAPAFQDRLPRLISRTSPSSPGYQPRDGEAGHWMLRVGFGRADPLYFNHTFRYLSGGSRAFGYAVENDLRNRKPQIYAVLPDGSLDFGTTSYGWGNLALSEPDTVEEFVKLIRWFFDEYRPDYKEFSVIPNDVWVPSMGDLHLLDPELQERIRSEVGLEQVRGTTRISLSPELMREFVAASSHIYWEFVSKVAWQIYESHPDRFIGVLGGYGGYGAASVASQYDLPPNIAVCITKSRWNYWNREDMRKMHEEVKAWSEITPHLYTWEYYIWNWRGWPDRPKMEGYPVFFPTLLQEDLQFMREYMVGEKIQSEAWINEFPGLNHLMLYLTGKLLYNPDLQVDDLLDEYYPAFYGNAAGPMREFWERAEECWMRDTSALDDYRTESEAIIETVYATGDLRFFFERLEEAKSLVADGSPEYERIAMIEEEMGMHRGRLEEGSPVARQYYSSAVFPAPENDGNYHGEWPREPMVLLDESGEEAEPATLVKVSHDPQNLYLTFRAEEESGFDLPSETDSGYWYWVGKGQYIPRGGGNSLLVELQPEGEKETMAAVLVNCTGKSVTAFYGDPDLADPAHWGGWVQVNTRITDSGWTGTVTIPWEALGVRLQPGMGVRANVTRYRAGIGTTSWSTDPMKYGTVGERAEQFNVIYFPED